MFLLKTNSSLIQYILTTVSLPPLLLSPPSSSPIPWIHSPSEFHQKRADLQERQPNMSKQNRLRQGENRAKQPNRSERVRDTHSHS